MRLKELASQLAVCRLTGDGDTEISGIQFDSRRVRPGDLFVCVSERPGIQDRHEFARQAVLQGAAALVVERDVEAEVPTLYVKDGWRALAELSAHFYGYPSERLKLIGVTGTNGKSTTTSLIEQMLARCGLKTGMMGTGVTKIGSQTLTTTGTTQDANDLQKHLREMADIGTEYCVMEVSSHALELGRVHGARFRTAVFTNLTQDHLDFHGSMERYRAAKGVLFERMDNAFASAPERRQFAVLNADDEASAVYASRTAAQVITYGIERPADVRAERIALTARGTRFRCVTFRGEADIEMKLVGRFNVYNALAAIAALLAEGIALERIAGALAEASPVEGRMEVVSAGQPFLVLVDYAHTPDGLDNALTAIRQFAEGRVYCVFGCGGDRDRTKRPLMGETAARLADYLLVTSDNPRSEDPEAILRDIVPGIERAGLPPDRYELAVDRRSAIQKAIDQAAPGDVVLIAGKGHETYQEIAGVRHEFDDRLVAKQAIRGRYHD